jgi:hypothetical protein
MLVADITSSDFNSYASVTDLKAFADSRGFTIPSVDTECEQLLVQAMDYLDGLEWRGERADPTQPLAWPRSGLRLDGIDLPCNTIPRQIIATQCRLAVESQEIDLTPSVAGGGAVTMERVEGAVTVQYEAGTAKNMPSFPWLYASLRGLVVGGNQVRVNRG